LRETITAYLITLSQTTMVVAYTFMETITAYQTITSAQTIGMAYGLIIQTTT